MAETFCWFVLLLFCKEGGVKIIGVIPARYASSRFPGKPLADIHGKPMIWWVYQQCKKSDVFSTVLVALEDKRVEEVCTQLAIPFVYTSVDHATPAGRIAEVATTVHGDLFVGIMGDEPLVNPKSFYDLIPHGDIPDLYVAMLIKRLDTPADVVDTTNQKVVLNANGDIMLMSRSPIPYPKGISDINYLGIGSAFAATTAALKLYQNTERSLLEKAEENDLIRWLYQGVSVKGVYSEYKTISVDAPKDLDKVREILSKPKMD
jgi:3-deoxy-manno-octulosonate cytidylyltransferase (CMP-KDO synthetase)